MNEKSIEETHPSLKGKIYSKWYERLERDDAGALVYVTTVQETQIDKQKLRKAIIVAKKWEGCKGKEWDDILFDELGLYEDEDNE